MARRDGFPDQWGSKQVGVIVVTGPSSYTRYTTGPPAGGQTQQALPEAGVKNIDFAMGGASADGTHRVEVVSVEASTLLGVSLGDTLLRLKWWVTAQAAGAADLEAAGAADLSGQTAIVLIVGDK